MFIVADTIIIRAIHSEPMSIYSGLDDRTILKSKERKNYNLKRMNNLIVSNCIKYLDRVK